MSCPSGREWLAIALALVLVVLALAPSVFGEIPIDRSGEGTLGSFVESSEEWLSYFSVTGQSLSTGDWPLLANQGDFNNDSLPDIAVASQKEERIEIFYQSSNGIFSKSPDMIIELTSPPTGMDAGDLDADGMDDLVVSLAEEDEINVFYQSGGFSTPLIVTAFQHPYGVIIDDFDGDDYNDFAVVNNKNSTSNNCTFTVHLYEADFFGFMHTLYIHSTYRATVIMSEDLDQDGKPDLFFADPIYDRVTVFKNDITAAGGDDWTFFQSISIDGPVALCSAEVDGSGYPEIIVTAGGEEAVRLLHYDLAQDEIILWRTKSGLASPSTAVMIDLVGDDRLDLVICSLAENRVEIFETKDSAYGSDPDSSFPCHASPIASIPYDMDGDGLQDLILTCNATSSNGSVTIYYGDEDGITNSDLNTFYQSGSPQITIIGDFDSDGDREIGALMDPDSVVFITNDSVEMGSKSLGGGPHDALAYDLNGGVMDLAVSNWASDNITVFWGGTEFYGSSSPSLDLQTISGPNAIAASNLSVDDLPELVVACQDGFQVFMNSGISPFFNPSSTINLSAPGANFTHVVIGDFNVGYEESNLEPALEDIALVNQSTGSVEIYMSDPTSPQFSTPSTTSLTPAHGGGITWLGTGLVNDDDLLDLIVATGDGHLVVYYQDRGFDHGFDESNGYSFSPPFGISDATLGDIDDDGLDEICVVGEEIDVITLLNVDDASHDAIGNLTGGAGEGHLLVGDLDGDSREDLLLSSALSGSTSIWYQRNLSPVAVCEVVSTPPLEEGQEIAFTGANSTDSFSDIDSLEYHWDFGDGGEAYGKEVAHEFMDNGTYQVTLMVTDREGLHNASTILVEIVDRAPMALFSCPTSAEEGTMVQFTDLSTSYPDQIVKWEWEFGDGTREIVEEGDPNVTHVYMQHGESYQVNLTVYDDDGTSDDHSLSIEINDLAPTAGLEASDTTPSEGDLVTFTSTSTSYPDEILNWTWDFGDGETGYGQQVSHIYMSDVGSPFTVILTVMDEDGSTDEAQMDIDVLDIPPSASFQFSPGNPFEGEQVQFTDTSTTHHPLVNWTWDFGDGEMGYGQQTGHVYESDGVYMVNMTTTDSDGSSDWFVTQIEVSDTANADFRWFAPSPAEGQEIEFLDNSSSYHKIQEWHWDFGDGGTSDQQNPIHVYDDNGSFTITLTITDDDGSSSNLSQIIQISDTSPVAISIVTSSGSYDFQEDDRIEMEVDYHENWDSVLRYEWDFHFSSSEPFQSEKTTDTAQTHCTYADEGTYTVAVRVWDADSYGMVSRTFRVSNVCPVAIISYHNLTNGSIFFDASYCTDTEGDYPELEFQWNFGDGEGWTTFSKENKVVIKTYEEEGQYNVSLKVRDDDGEWDSDYVLIYQDRTPPQIEVMRFSHKASVGEVVEISFKVTDAVGVDKVLLYYKIDNQTQSKVMSRSSEELFVAFVPAQNSSANVTVWATAWDLVGNYASTGELEIQIRPASNTELLVAGVIGSGLAVFGGFLYYRRRFAVDEVFLIFEDGCLLAHETRRLKPGMDDEILGSMLVAIQGFVKDSFKDEEVTALKRMDFGEKKVLVEKGDSVYLAVVLHGSGGERVKQKMQHVLEDIESEYGETLREWDGNLENLRGVKERSRKVFESGNPLHLPLHLLKGDHLTKDSERGSDTESDTDSDNE